MATNPSMLGAWDGKKPVKQNGTVWGGPLTSTQYPPTVGPTPGSSGDYKQKVEEGLGTYRKKAFGLENTENQRGASMEDYLRKANDKANVPTLSQETIDRQFASGVDSGAGQFQDQMAGLREYMGASGVTGGGLPAGIAANAEMERLGQLTQTRGDLMAFKATSDAQDRMKAFDRETKVADAINRPVSMLGMDAEQGTLQTRLAELGVQTSAEGAQAQAKATKQAGKDAKTGSLLGSAGGLAAK